MTLQAKAKRVAHRSAVFVSGPTLPLLSFLQVTLTNQMFKFAWMTSVLTDTHFFQRDRMGRLMTFLARSIDNGWTGARSAALGVAISEHTAVLLDSASGQASMLGVGPTYFLLGSRAAHTLAHTPLTFEEVIVHKWDGSGTAATDASFSFSAWAEHGRIESAGLASYNISAIAGVLSSTQASGSVY